MIFIKLNLTWIWDTLSVILKFNWQKKHFDQLSTYFKVDFFIHLNLPGTETFYKSDFKFWLTEKVLCSTIHLFYMIDFIISKSARILSYQSDFKIWPGQNTRFLTKLYILKGLSQLMGCVGFSVIDACRTTNITHLW